MRSFAYVLVLVFSVGIGTLYGTRYNARRTEQQVDLNAEQQVKQQAEREVNRQAELKTEQEAEQTRQAEQQVDNAREAEQVAAQQAARKAAKQAAQTVKQEAAQRAAKQAAQIAKQDAAQNAARIDEHVRRFAQHLEERTAKYLFYKRLRYAGKLHQVRKFRTSADEHNAHHRLRIDESTANKQVAMIQKRISEALELANALALKGDKSMHRKFDEVEALTNQSFDVRVEQNIRMAGYRAGLSGGNTQYDTLDRERGIALRELDAQRVAAERQALTVSSQ